MSTEYSTSIKSTDFLYLELKKVAQIKFENSNLSSKEIKIKAIEDNIFQVDTLNRRKAIANAIIKRIEVLDGYLLQQLVTGSIESSKQIALYTMLKTDRLLFEFMIEVYREKFLLKDLYLEDKDFNIFFQRKSEQSDKVAGWKDYTYYKLKQTIIRILFEAGFIDDKDESRIMKPLINLGVVEHLKDIGDSKYLKAMLY